jgi:hypothetical protein
VLQDEFAKGDKIMQIKVYNNKSKMHFLNFPKIFIGKVSNILYAIKIYDFVIEFWRL